LTVNLRFFGLREGLVALLFFVAPSIHLVLLPDVDALRSALAWLGLLFAVRLLPPVCDDTNARFFAAFLVGLLMAALWTVVSVWAQWADAERFFGGLVFELTSGRLAGNLRQANHAATLICFGVIAALEFKRLAWLSHGALLALLGVFFSTVLLTESRTALINLCLLLLLWNLPSKRQDVRRRWHLLAATGIVFVAIFLIIWVTLHRDPTLSSKTILWSRNLQLLSESPWIGHGWGNFAFNNFLQTSGFTYPNEVLDNPHNLILSAVYSWGLPVGFALTVLAVWTVWSVYRRTPPAEQRWTGSVLLVTGVHSLFEYPLWYGVFQVTTLVALLPGVLAVLSTARIRRMPRFILGMSWGLCVVVWTGVLAYHLTLNQLYAGRISAPMWRLVNFVGEPVSEKYLMYYRAIVEFEHGRCSEAAAGRLDSALRRFPEPAVITRWLACAEEGHFKERKTAVSDAFEFHFPAAFAEWKKATNIGDSR